MTTFNLAVTEDEDRLFGLVDVIQGAYTGTDFNLAVTEDEDTLLAYVSVSGISSSEVTIYWSVTPTTQAEPTAAQIIAGSAPNSINGNSAAPVLTTVGFEQSVTGVENNVTYRQSWVASDGANNSPVVHSPPLTVTEVEVILGVGQINLQGFNSEIIIGNQANIQLGVGQINIEGFPVEVASQAPAGINLKVGQINIEGFDVEVTFPIPIVLGVGEIQIEGFPVEVQIGPWSDIPPGEVIWEDV